MDFCYKNYLFIISYLFKIDFKIVQMGIIKVVTYPSILFKYIPLISYLSLFYDYKTS